MAMMDIRPPVQSAELREREASDTGDDGAKEPQFLDIDLDLRAASPFALAKHKPPAVLTPRPKERQELCAANVEQSRVQVTRYFCGCMKDCFGFFIGAKFSRCICQ